jgi:predicted ribosomally synthesized peptide with nif11-like leader
MKISEIQRLANDMKNQTELHEAVKLDLKNCNMPEEAIRIIQERGYMINLEDVVLAKNISPEKINSVGMVLSDEDLEHVSGGNLDIRWIIGGPLMTAFDQQAALAKDSFHFP